MTKWLVGVILALLVIIAVMWSQVHYANKKWGTAEANVKAYANQMKVKDKQSLALQLTIDQLEYFNDSVLSTLDETRKELNIKDKNLKALQAISSSFSKKDTIYIPGDTIFKEPSFALDTIIGDEWYTLKLGLKYPSMIAVEPNFESKKHIVVSTKKETVNPPKKFFLFRWFQRKQKILHVNVEEKNPYVNNESSEYIEIMK